MLVSYLTLNLIAVVIRPTQQSWSPVFLRRGVNSGSSSVFGEPEEPWGRHRPVLYEYDWTSVCRGEKQEEQQNKKKKPERVPSAACWRDWRLNEAEGFPSASLVMKLFVYVHLLRREDSPLQQESLASLLSKHTWEGCCHYLHSVHINRGGQLAECAIKTGTESITRAAGSLLCECKFDFQRENWTIATSEKSRLALHSTRKKMWRLSLRGTFYFFGGRGIRMFHHIGGLIVTFQKPTSLTNVKVHRVSRALVFSFLTRILPSVFVSECSTVTKGDCLKVPLCYIPFFSVVQTTLKTPFQTLSWFWSIYSLHWVDLCGVIVPQQTKWNKWINKNKVMDPISILEQALCQHPLVFTSDRPWP